MNDDSSLDERVYEIIFRFLGHLHEGEQIISELLRKLHHIYELRMHFGFKCCMLA